LTDRLPTLTPQRIVKALKRAGFVEVDQKGSHLLLEHPETKLQTTVPMHGRDLKRPLMKAILKQAGLSEKMFRELL
jgi:predicted RNA binding protein YcfA (HicA-like mRNA interferase family)